MNSELADPYTIFNKKLDLIKYETYRPITHRQRVLSTQP